MTRNDVDIDEVLRERTVLKDSIFDHDFTKTTLFILQMLGYRYIAMPTYFVNAYIGDSTVELGINNPICLLFKTDMVNAHRDRRWVDFEKGLRENPCYSYRYYAGKDEQGFDLVMYVYEAPELFVDDYRNFISGKYSQFSDAYKHIFPKLTIVNNRSQPSLHYRVLERDDELKQELEEILGTYLDETAELWAIPEFNREIFRHEDRTIGAINAPA